MNDGAFRWVDPVKRCALEYARPDVVSVEGTFTGLHRNDEAEHRFDGPHPPEVFFIRQIALVLRKPKEWYSPPVRIELCVGCTGLIVASRNFFRGDCVLALEVPQRLGENAGFLVRVRHVPSDYGLHIDFVRGHSY